MTTPTNAGLRILNPSVIPLFRGDSDTQVIAVESVLVKLERTACAPELARNALALLDWITFAARAQDVDLTSKPVHLDPARARQVLQFSTTQWRESVHVLHRLRVMVPKQKQRYAIQPDVLTYHPSRAQFRPDLIATHATAKVGPVALIGAARALLVLTGVADVDVALPPVVVSVRGPEGADRRRPRDRRTGTRRVLAHAGVLRHDGRDVRARAACRREAAAPRDAPSHGATRAECGDHCDDQRSHRRDGRAGNLERRVRTVRESHSDRGVVARRTRALRQGAAQLTRLPHQSRRIQRICARQRRHVTTADG
jgi:hypothetical protein